MGGRGTDDDDTLERHTHTHTHTHTQAHKTHLRPILQTPIRLRIRTLRAIVVMASFASPGMRTNTNPMRTIGGLVDYLLVVAVQSFMLLQVGFFDAIRRLLGRLRPPPPLHSPAAALPPLRTVSVVLPTYNEERSIRHCLDALHHGVASLDDVEVIVVDGGCRDRTMDLVAEWSAAHPRLRLLRETSHGGRGPAVRAGVRHATGDAVLVLHADTALPALWDALLLRSLSDRAVLMTAFSFQCDRAQLAEAHSPPAGLALMEWTVNLRSRWYELPFGDQALATTRATLDALGGYPPTCDYPRDYPRDQPRSTETSRAAFRRARCILEEYMLVNQVRRQTAGGAARIATLDAAALCSPRRWERGKVWRVNAINQAVMLWHKLGATPAQIFSFYYGVPAPDAHAPAEWDPLSRCVNGRRSAAWAASFASRRAAFRARVSLLSRQLRARIKQARRLCARAALRGHQPRGGDLCAGPLLAAPHGGGAARSARPACVRRRLPFRLCARPF